MKNEKTINELLNDYNELVAQFNNDPDNTSKLQVLKSWKAAKSKLVERIEILETKIKPVEVNVDELLDTGNDDETPATAHIVRDGDNDLCSACGHIVEGDEEICVSCHRVIDVEVVETKKPAPKKRANGIDWNGTCVRQDMVEFKALKENSKLYDVFTFCDGERTLDEIVKKYTGTDERSLKKQIRAIVRRGYTLKITDGKINLDVPYTFDMPS